MSDLGKLFIGIFGILCSLVHIGIGPIVTILVLMYGWGLEPVSWWWIIGGAVFWWSSTISVILSNLLKELSK